MSYNRVIQDSDDEDDLEIPPPPDPNPTDHQQQQQQQYHENNVHPINGDIGHEANNTCEGTNHGPIGVNFDDFLQSQSHEAVQPRLSASQQRREERWIPGESGAGGGGGGGSIGSMMTEIGLAQRRLFDDESNGGPQMDGEYEGGQYVSVQGPQENGFNQVEAVGFDHLPQDMHPVQSYGQEVYQNGYNQVEMPVASEHLQSDTYPAQNYGQIHHNGYETTEQQLGESGYDQTQSAASYNLFEMSLNPSMNADATHPTSMNSTDTVQTELLRKTPRSKSMQMAASPHDTEPLSSMMSPAASRARSDIGQNLPQSSSRTDELAAPVAIEIPPVKKKRGRKKKQPVPENDEDDELAQVNQSGSNNEKTSNGQSMDSHQPETVAPQEGNEADAPPDLGTSNANDAQETKENHPQVVVAVDVQQRPTKDVSFAETTKTTAKEPKKKKLKRGKTTSITVKKTYESDVDDDVIWVDERPAKPGLDIQNLAPLPDTNGDAKTPASNEEAEPAPAPKKRGRKRKKTAEQLAAEAKTADANEFLPQDEAVSNPQPDDNPTPVIENPVDSGDQPTTNENTTDSTAILLVNDQQDPPPDTSAPEPALPPETPKRPDPNVTTPSTKYTSKGPSKHSPISSTSKVPYRVGLSRRARIAPLLKVVKR